MRLALLAVPLLCLSSMANADPVEEIGRCRGIADSAARLACYDAIQVSGAGSARASEADDFGRPASEAPDRQQEIRSTIVGSFDGWSGNTRIRLENGQIWEVVDGSSGYVGPANRQVTIRRSLFGSYRMTFEGLHMSPAVRRIK